MKSNRDLPKPEAKKSTNGYLLGGVLALAIGAGGYAALRPPAATQDTERTDFDLTRTSTEPTYAAGLEPASDAPVKTFRIPITHETVRIADGVDYDGWTYGGTVPGPAMRVRQGDRVEVTLVNQAPIPHSIDFHSARIPMNEAYRTIGPGEELTFEFTARDPGAYLVHCGTPPVLMHLSRGMYMAFIVDPKDGWGTEADREFVVVQSEFYAGDGTDASPRQPDYGAALDKRASHVAFNGQAFQYREHPLEVDVGDRVRFFLVNAGPSLRSDFHIVGAVFDRVYPDGNPDNALESVQTWTVPAGGGAVFETVFEEGASDEGIYAFVTHAFADAEKGAVGLIQVGTPKIVARAGR